MEITNEELYRLRDKAIDNYHECKIHISSADSVLSDIYTHRNNVTDNFNETINKINVQADRVKTQKYKLITVEHELEKQIRDFNSLIAGRRANRNV